MEHELANFLLGAKAKSAFTGVIMVTDKIRNDPNWRMWTAIAAVIVPAMAFVTWSHANMVEHIDLKLEPLTILIGENTHARKQGGRYTFGMAQEDKIINRNTHTRMQKQIDHLNEMIVGEDRFSKEGAKMDQRIIRLEERVFK